MYGDGTRFHSRNMKCGNSVDSTFAGSPAELWGSGKVCRNGCSCVGSKHIFDHDSQLTIVLVYFRLMLLEISEHGHSQIRTRCHLSRKRGRMDALVASLVRLGSVEYSRHVNHLIVHVAVQSLSLHACDSHLSTLATSIISRRVFYARPALSPSDFQSSCVRIHS